VSNATGNDDAANVSTSKVVTTVFEQILAAVHEGTLLPGARISDAELAKQFGVSRTPVREAIQRLRELGVIEASASRFTRVAEVTPIQTAQAYVVWLALFSTLLEEVVPRATPSTLQLMEADHADFMRALEQPDAQRLATANFMFFSRLLPDSGNAILQRSITSVVHIVRLGSLHLPAYIDLDAVGRAQQTVIDAVRTKDIAKGREAVRILRRIEVPQE
jgi:DNA-binding GntR family transcriptional regulator